MMPCSGDVGMGASRANWCYVAGDVPEQAGHLGIFTKFNKLIHSFTRIYDIDLILT